MAAAAQLGNLQVEATCSICLEYFTDPVSIECGHNFCRSCITQSWGGRDENFPCPQCREISSGKNLRPNRQLGNMVEMVKQPHLPPVKPQGENLCEKHDEKLRLFCAEDQRMICWVCRESKEHETHSASPVEEAAEEHKDVRSTLSRCNNVKIQCPEVVKSYKVMVTLDPDTAHRGLRLSDGWRRVRDTDTAQPLPDPPKRFAYWPCVLGSEGFTSGRHYWEVQLMQEGVRWHVGVAAESVKRKEYFTVSPEEGVWAVEGCDGNYEALTSPETPLSPREKPLKLGVYLDYEGGRLSLYNADSMEHLYTFPHIPFTERLFPIFYLYGGAEMKLV
ncbi:E3 ubiquitin-protein ligase TRIM39-like [Lissotriton helveticus]